MAYTPRDEACRRLIEIPGIGATIATALVAAIGRGRAFEAGRAMAAWLGLVPRQRSTGGVPRLLGISKRGNKYLRKLLVHGARAALPHLAQQPYPLGRWLAGLLARAHRNVAVMALANKLARIAWAVLTARRPEPLGLERRIHDCVAVVAARRRSAHARTRFEKARDAIADQAVSERRVARPRGIEADAPLEQVGHELLLVVLDLESGDRAVAGKLACVEADELHGARMNAVVAVCALHEFRRRSGDGLQARTPASRRHVAAEQAEAPRLAALPERPAREKAVMTAP
jgi:hypothetical protein